jgi:hypothetical protein
VFMNDTDRRYYVVEVAAGPIPTLEADRIAKWRDDGGLGHLRHYLENVDTSSFNENAPAPMTAAKRDMADSNESDVERWLSDLLDVADLRPYLGRELVTSRELAQRYYADTDKTVTDRSIASALGRKGILRLGKQAEQKNGRRPRVYALRNADAYRDLSGKDLGEIMDRSLKLN